MKIYELHNEDFKNPIKLVIEEDDELRVNKSLELLYENIKENNKNSHYCIGILVYELKDKLYLEEKLLRLMPEIKYSVSNKYAKKDKSLGIYLMDNANDFVTFLNREFTSIYVYNTFDMNISFPMMAYQRIGRFPNKKTHGEEISNKKKCELICDIKELTPGSWLYDIFNPYILYEKLSNNIDKKPQEQKKKLKI